MPKTQARALMLALVMKPVRFLTTHLLGAIRELPKPNSVPPLLNAIDVGRSVLFVVLQYLSSLLRGSGACLAFIYKHAGFEPYSTWHH